MTYYNTNNIDIEYELGVLRTAYCNMQNAYLSGNRSWIKYELNNTANLQIRGFLL